MSIYKVSIATNGDKTAYTINGHILAAVTNTPTGYTVTVNGKEQTFTTSIEADTEARAAVTKILASVGCTPNFINK